ncbi:CIA30 family protein [Croceitalea sp. MTPC5]|uniref:CIA30 family protein n=1 Tax=Croceitalea sp. MTPC5 TaxID=3056565 RepID=UPI002B3F4F84|nr:CIA30 family protein [Croceitalea sp. MTPC5]
MNHNIFKPIVLFNFTRNSDLSNWKIANDIVMGGKSSSTISINDMGHGIFRGTVSLENNGGFASVRFQHKPFATQNHTIIKIILKGDGKRYQFRIKDTSGNDWSYVNYFKTSKTWETIEIPLESLYPNFRGRRLSVPNFDKQEIASFGFLIGNKKAESFQLEIDTISLE